MRSEEVVAPSLDEPETSFSSSEDERFACAPIIEGGLRTITFKTDTMEFFELIYVITRDLDCWTYVQRTRDVIKTYHDLWDPFLGPDNVDNMASEAKRLLVTTHY